MKWTNREESALVSGLEALTIFETQDELKEAAEKLNAFARELLLWNKTHSLVSLSEGPLELVHRHFLDSLAAFPYLGRPATLADIGSGAGLPGIPLAIALKNTRVSLIEKMGRRCDFLRNVIIVTGLSERVEVLQIPLERCSLTFDAVTLRAFAPIPRVVDGLRRITAPGGRIFAYKGREEALREELKEEPGAEVKSLNVPGLNADRQLVILEA